MGWQLPTAELTAVLLASVRAAAWLVIAPPWGGHMIPGRVKALLSVAIALPIAPRLAGQVPGMGTSEFLVSLVEQVVVGAALGFLTAVAFAAIQSAGNLIDLFGGFAVAFAFDPFAASGNTGTAAFGRFYNLVATTLLFATGGHQLMLLGFTTSYQALPASGALSWHTLQQLINHGVGDMFVATVQIAAPLIAVLFCTDVALGLLNRVAPALNAFSLGFPAKILLTISGAGLAIALLPQTVRNVVEHAVLATLAAVGR